MAKKVSFKNVLLVGLLWSTVYFAAGQHFFAHFYPQFNVFSLTSWNNLLFDFKNEYFKVDTLDTLGFFTALLIFYPLWLWGWYLLRHFDVIKFLKRITTLPKKYKPQKMEPKKFVPRPMTVQGTFSNDHIMAQTATPTHSNTSGASAPVSTSSVPKSSFVDPADAIIAFAQGFQVECFKNILINGHSANLSLATDERALLIKIFDTPDLTYFFDSDQNTPDSIWFSEQGHIPSPIYDLVSLNADLNAENEGAETKMLIALRAGSFADYPGAVEICNAYNIQLVQFNNEQMPELPTLQSVIETYFVRKAA